MVRGCFVTSQFHQAPNLSDLHLTQLKFVIDNLALPDKSANRRNGLAPPMWGNSIGAVIKLKLKCTFKKSKFHQRANSISSSSISPTCVSDLNLLSSSFHHTKSIPFNSRSNKKLMEYNKESWLKGKA